MVNGLGVLGWGVGGIEAEAAMLGQPVSMLIPRVVGFKLTGQLPEGATATDLVLTITELLRKHGVVGKFVEFYGDGVGAVPLANRATIGNMSPEYGSTCAIFPIDEETLRYLRLTGRTGRAGRAGRGLRPRAGPVARPVGRAGVLRVRRARPRHGRAVDRRPEAPAGPGRAAPTRASGFRAALADYARGAGQDEQPLSAVDEAGAESFPASDAPAASHGNGAGGRPAEVRTSGRRCGRPAQPAHHASCWRTGPTCEIDHGAVVIASITSCTNTSNPSVMVGAALLAKKAVERGLSSKPWVKTTLAPGSKVVTDYYDRAGLTPYLEKLGFDLVGYGCITCIGNSGPLPEAVSAAVERLRPRGRLGAVRQPQLRGPDQPGRQDELPGVAAAGRRVRHRRLDGRRHRDRIRSAPTRTAHPVYLRDIWPSAARGRRRSSTRAIAAEMFTSDYADVFAGDERWQSLPTPTGDDLRLGPRLDVRAQARRTSRGCRASRSRSPTSPVPGCSPSSATR